MDPCKDVRSSSTFAGTLITHEEAMTQVSNKELLDSLKFIRTHLYAAQAQFAPGDDVIISRHVYDAYKRAQELCKEIELNGISGGDYRK